MRGFINGLAGVLVGICIYEAGNRNGYKRFIKVFKETLDIIDRSNSSKCDCCDKKEDK